MSKILCNLRPETFRVAPKFHSVLKCIISGAPKLMVVPNRTKYYHNRHRDQRYRLERARKVWPVELPDFDYLRKSQKNLSPDEIRTKMKEKGIAPPLSWNERELYQPCTISVIEPYEPFGTDGKSSSIMEKVKSPLSSGKDLFKNRRSLSAIRSYEGDEFKLEDFAIQAKEIYIKAHELLASNEKDKLFKYVTEHCWPVMTAGLDVQSIIWKYLDDIEPPAAVQVRIGDLMNKSNKYAQITVRFHSKQIMAVFDRHGRLILGSPTDVKEVLEYIVFEKYLSNEYGEWRIHERIRNDLALPDNHPIQTRVHEAI